METIKILVVDDEEEFASTLADRLELRGFNAEAVNCGEDALMKIVKEPPDVVVLDLKMPDMSGLEILNEIKESNPAIEVIMLTGHGSTASGIAGMKEGAYDYIMKPVEIGELAKKITQAAAKKKPPVD
ncbi:MAG: response regulator [Desulfobulbaceae bacterium]|nr:response regulator [Desulfobulbaceae bacterium]